ncbi:MAG: YbjN domain-containing protein [Brevundimonas sp.]|uniref:YbjN domain-containing protein n=1 Tax=Brevundimonas sp. TaxID=1871086 RepID=UPI00271DBA6C|nr:YbjN domain-containing protein [Brevundimonas sp.]MDO9588033.1 YbjN domain-containing protein [Brevundimonas sp.]MDP3368778.1 YbjN domain-containing protein [Brevundimonas sp.]MDP3655644.1 YbjN domain-containing protein [Brevundimonas sp.]
MRRLPVLLAVLSFAAAAPSMALAQTPSPAVASPNGVAVAEARAWLTSMGGSVGEPTVQDGVTSLHVADQPLPWNLTFYACGPSLCDDVQYSAIFSGSISPDQINAWNRDNRFLKAFFVPAAAGGEASAVVQYDVVLTGAGTDQLREPTVIWLQMLRTFAQGLVGPAPAAAVPVQ